MWILSSILVHHSSFTDPWILWMSQAMPAVLASPCSQRSHFFAPWGLRQAAVVVRIEVRPVFIFHFLPCHGRRD